MEDNVRGAEQDRSHDTRSRLRELALRLFAEQGYEKTSLREIAEQLGVTKAALYYYFKSKEDIVRSYLHIVANGAEVFRMLHQNQAAVSGFANAKERGEVFKERIDALVDLLTEPGAPLSAQIRAASCLMSVSFCCMHYRDRAASAAELEAAVLDVALELADVAPARSHA
jgi:AcrR family transcriptional regulator